MKLNQLRQIIREEVRAAVKEELQEVMNEAVKYASTPNNQVQEQPSAQPKKSNLDWSTPKVGNKTLQEMLQSTQQNMTSQDYRSINHFDSSAATKPNLASSMVNQIGMSGGAPGLDISQLDFVKKASSVYNLAVEKGKNK